MKNKKALVSLGLTFLLLCSGCASEVENVDGIDIVYTKTEQAAQTIYTEEATVQTDNVPVTGNATSSGEETVSEKSTTAVTVSAVESATTPVTAVITTSSAKPAATAADKPKPNTTAAAATAATAAATTAAVTTNAAPVVTTQKENEPVAVKYNDNLTTAQIVKNMGLGINLGNTLEACGDWINPAGGQQAYEKAWGSPVITKEIIEGYAKCGFGVLRIPVAWSNIMSEDYTISKVLMDRVKQITQWTIESGMYAIVNIHWDSGWWEKFPEDKANCMKKYTRIWEQICEGFKDFDGRVMFESLNEEGGSWENLWNRYTNEGDKKASYNLLNEINQKFVDIVRSSGGKNGIRHLLIAGFCTDIGQTCDELYKMPDDPKNRCAVSVHYYTPVSFALIEEDADWGKAQTTWGSEVEKRELAQNMDMMKTNFTDKGIPVIIGEYAVAKKNKTPEMIRLYMSSVTRAAIERNLCPVIWDIPEGYYDRQNYKFYDDELLKAIMAAAN